MCEGTNVLPVHQHILIMRVVETIDSQKLEDRDINDKLL
jgi:hypothetical protein